MKLPGLPEGVECVRIGLPKSGDFVIQHSKESFSISRSDTVHAFTAVIVRPGPGYDFLVSQQGSYEYDLVKKIDPPVTIDAHLSFLVTNTRDQDRVHTAIEVLKQLPGYVAPSQDAQAPHEEA